MGTEAEVLTKTNAGSVSAEGFAGQAFNTHVPHTVRATETKTCIECHLSAKGDREMIGFAMDWLGALYGTDPTPQQLAVLRQMVRDLNFDLEIVPCPIVRDPDGLALSSRNRYLTPEERTHALVLPHTLRLIESRIAEGIRDTATLIEEATTRLSAEPGITLDYLAIVDPDTLLPVPAATPGTLIAIAAKAGTTRLIDNLIAL